MTALLILMTLAPFGLVRAQIDPSLIRAWVGMYPSERIRGVTFLEDPEVQTRINVALGPDAISEIKIMATVGPILERGGWLIAYGCQPNSCSDGKWWLAINLVTFEMRACLVSKDSQTIRFGASGRGYIDTPRVQDACPEPERIIPIFDQLFSRAIAAAPPVHATKPLEAPRFAIPEKGSAALTRVALKKSGGTFGVPIEINGKFTLDFVVDSGAADVSVPVDVFSTLVRTGTIRQSDIMGEQTYVLADGSKSKSVTFTIRSLRAGDKTVENVRGSVSSAQGILLLGQSFLERFKSWSIDNTTHELVLETQ